MITNEMKVLRDKIENSTLTETHKHITKTLLYTMPQPEYTVDTILNTLQPQENNVDALDFLCNMLFDSTIVGQKECITEFCGAVNTGRSADTYVNLFILNGPSGSGKRFLAKKIAEKTAKEFICIDSSEMKSVADLVDKGDGAGLIAERITQAGTTNCVIYIDEVDFDKNKKDTSHFLNSFVDSIFIDQHFLMPLNLASAIIVAGTIKSLDFMSDKIREINMEQYTTKQLRNLALRIAEEQLRKRRIISKISFSPKALTDIARNSTNPGEVYANVVAAIEDTVKKSGGKIRDKKEIYSQELSFSQSEGTTKTVIRTIFKNDESAVERLDKIRHPVIIKEIERLCSELYKRVEKDTHLIRKKEEMVKYLLYLDCVYGQIHFDYNHFLNYAKSRLVGLDDELEKLAKGLHFALRMKRAKVNILLNGANGVGKTTFCRILADYLNFSLVDIPFNSLSNNREILTGFSKTYTGSSAGYIVESVCYANRAKPDAIGTVIDLDEIEKASGNIQDIPLNMLDERGFMNDTFFDIKLPLPVNTIIVATTNDASKLGTALKNRFDIIIDIEGYTPAEKSEILQKVTLKSIESSLKGDLSFTISPKAADMIAANSCDAGVRVAKADLKTVVTEKMLQADCQSYHITEADVAAALGTGRRPFPYNDEITMPGFVLCMAAAGNSGAITPLTCLATEGKGGVTVTSTSDELGKSLTGTIDLAIAYIKSHYKLNFEDKHLYVHLRSGTDKATGASIGLAAVLAILSSMLKVGLQEKVAVTGEVSLLGNLYKIGRAKDKAVAALDSGLKAVMPAENATDLENLFDDGQIIGFRTVEEALNTLLPQAAVYKR